MSERTIEEMCRDLARGSRNAALDAAARVARLYGAPEEACDRILMLRAALEAPLSRKEPDVSGRAYGEWCRKPDACAGKGYCPLDPTCGD